MWNQQGSKRQVQEKGLLNSNVKPREKEDGEEMVYRGTIIIGETELQVNDNVEDELQKALGFEDDASKEGLEKEKEPEQGIKKAKEINLQIYLGRGHWVEAKQAAVRNFANFVCSSKEDADSLAKHLGENIKTLNKKAPKVYGAQEVPEGHKPLDVPRPYSEGSYFFRIHNSAYNDVAKFLKLPKDKQAFDKLQVCQQAGNAAGDTTVILNAGATPSSRCLVM
jgi:hypothetical protein